MLQKLLLKKTLAFVITMLIAFTFTEISGIAETKKIEHKENGADSIAIAKLIHEQMQAIHSGDIARGYFAYTTKDFRKVTSLDQFKKFVSSFPVFSENKSINLENLNFNKDYASYQGKLRAENGDTLKVEYELSQEDGEWKIMGIQILIPRLPSKENHK